MSVNKTHRNHLWNDFTASILHLPGLSSLMSLYCSLLTWYLNAKLKEKKYFISLNFIKQLEQINKAILSVDGGISYIE